MRGPPTILAVATFIAFASAALTAGGQELTGPSEWLDKLDRDHDNLVSKSGHAHARGKIEVIDSGPGTITLLAEEMESPDKSIWMPTMRMVFHVTNRRILEGLQPGDAVEFEAARLRGAVMITNIRKTR
jgi:Cu/Ag efflux protein CusF